MEANLNFDSVEH